mmetsp:Transcript_7784/g.11633  ORF Transcript_7784/g.11633 Transcript_7784/m.11633 type:complete len:91 (-) Transcript_7784:721-993(-)
MVKCQMSIVVASLLLQIFMFIAPMQCITNRFLRTFYRTMSSNAVLWTEMEKCDPIKVIKSWRVLVKANFILQLGGNNERNDLYLFLFMIL